MKKKSDYNLTANQIDNLINLPKESKKSIYKSYLNRKEFKKNDDTVDYYLKSLQNLKAYLQLPQQQQRKTTATTTVGADVCHSSLSLKEQSMTKSPADLLLPKNKAIRQGEGGGGRGAISDSDEHPTAPAAAVANMNLSEILNAIEDLKLALRTSPLRYENNQGKIERERRSFIK
jgi:hypothetical protein